MCLNCAVINQIMIKLSTLHFLPSWHMVNPDWVILIGVNKPQLKNISRAISPSAPYYQDYLKIGLNSSNLYYFSFPFFNNLQKPKSEWLFLKIWKLTGAFNRGAKGDASSISNRACTIIKFQNVFKLLENNE